LTVAALAGNLAPASTSPDQGELLEAPRRHAWGLFRGRWTVSSGIGDQRLRQDVLVGYVARAIAAAQIRAALAAELERDPGLRLSTGEQRAVREALLRQVRTIDDALAERREAMEIDTRGSRVIDALAQMFEEA